MANLVAPYLRTLADLWNGVTHDEVFSELDEFKGGAAWNSWHTQYRRAEQQQVNREYIGLANRFNEAPSFLTFLSDNILRLTVFTGLERLLTLRQAHDGLKTRFFFPDSNAGALQTMVVNGFFKGYFRGALLNLAHFSGATYQTFVWAWKQSFSEQLIFSTLFQTVFYPLDTVKTLLYADMKGTFRGGFDCVGRVFQESGFTGLYRGLPFKLLYNLAFFSHLKNFYEDSIFMYITTPLWLLSYGLLTLKTRNQIADSPLSFNLTSDLKNYQARLGPNPFRGLLPFALLNLLVSYQFYPLYSDESRKTLLDEIASRGRHVTPNQSIPKW